MIHSFNIYVYGESYHVLGTIVVIKDTDKISCPQGAYFW